MKIKKRLKNLSSTIPTIGTKMWCKQIQSALNSPGFSFKPSSQITQLVEEKSRGDKLLNKAKVFLQMNL